MKTAIMKLEDIRPAAYNPRVELKPGDKEWEALKNSLDRFGVAEPLIVNTVTGNLISGHQRLNVLKASGAKEAEAVVVELDPEKEKLLNIALNKIDGYWDYDKLEALFSEFEASNIPFTGFDEKEVENLFGDEEPEWGSGDEDAQEEAATASAEGTDGQEPEAPEEAQEFSIFLSFPTKELAEKWLEGKGVELKYKGAARNITIRMEGLEYGAGDPGDGAE